jgi:hypothetical protein
MACCLIIGTCLATCAKNSIRLVNNLGRMSNQKHSFLWPLSLPAREHTSYITAVPHYNTVLRFQHLGKKAKEKREAQVRLGSGQNLFSETSTSSATLSRLCLVFVIVHIFTLGASPTTLFSLHCNPSPRTMLPGHLRMSSPPLEPTNKSYYFYRILHEDLVPHF